MKNRPTRCEDCSRLIAFNQRDPLFICELSTGEEIGICRQCYVERKTSGKKERKHE